MLHVRHKYVIEIAEEVDHEELIFHGDEGEVERLDPRPDACVDGVGRDEIAVELVVDLRTGHTCGEDVQS